MARTAAKGALLRPTGGGLSATLAAGVDLAVDGVWRAKRTACGHENCRRRVVLVTRAAH